MASITCQNNRFRKFLTGKINQFQQNHRLSHIEIVNFFVKKTIVGDHGCDLNGIFNGL